MEASAQRGTRPPMEQAIAARCDVRDVRNEVSDESQN
jgi:hypothetical protein